MCLRRAASRPTAQLVFTKVCHPFSNSNSELELLPLFTFTFDFHLLFPLPRSSSLLFQTYVDVRLKMELLY